MGDSPAKTTFLKNMFFTALLPFPTQRKTSFCPLLPKQNNFEDLGKDASGSESQANTCPFFSEDRNAASENLLFTYVLAGVGFSCLVGWELSAVFSPSLVLLSFCSVNEALILRIASVLALSMTFVLCAQKADWVFQHRNRLFTFGSLLALLAVLNAAVNLAFPRLPLMFSFVVWILFGVAQGSMMMYWCTFFSLIPTRGTAATIGIGSVFGTLLFLIVNASSTAALSLAGIALLIAISAGLAALLTTQSSVVCVFEPHEYLHSAILSRAGIFSAASQGIVYGFMSIELCFMGPEVALVGGASGIFGTVLALIWGLLGPRVDITVGVVQRISLPLLVASLLLFPLFNDVGRIVCGCIANTTLAHSSVVSWYSTSIDNSEFRLHPIDRFAQRQAPTWAGFFVGTVVAYLVIMRFSLTGTALYMMMIVLSLIVVSSFCCYSGDDSETKRKLDELLNPPSRNTSPVAELQQEAAGEPSSHDAILPNDSNNVPEEWQDNFNRRCEVAAKRFGLTPRETEVFHLLARGRNADYIANHLMVSPATVKSHIYHIYQKLGINSQQHLMNIVDESTE